jgi:plasmid replication initiation protein
LRLDPHDVEAIARRVAELVGTAQPPAVRYVDAAEVARAVGVERNWVYAHARELGAIRLGGTHGRLRFDLREVTRALADRRGEPPAAAPAPRSPPRRSRPRDWSRRPTRANVVRPPGGDRGGR